MVVNSDLLKNLKEVFAARFNETPIIVRSPGRVNIIGEHTDYNEGFVLPAAINKAIYVAISRRNDRKMVLYSLAYDETFEIALAEIKPGAAKGWPNYIIGMAAQLMKTGHALGGVSLAFDGDIPIGSGLSSSAALEAAAGRALAACFNIELQKRALAEMAQTSEHEYAGVRVGIMDMFASIFGKKDHVIKLDCRSLDYEYVPLVLTGYSVLLLNTNVKHALNDSEYNTRRQQCEQGVEWIREKVKTVHSLRDADHDMLRDLVLPKNELIYRRCKYVVEENERLLKACAALQQGKLEEMGRLMYGSHDGLSHDYEVSCEELDFLVEEVRNKPGVLGARMMGGGFGGCTINIVSNEVIETLIASAGPSYLSRFGKELTPYIAVIDDGTSVIS